MAAFLVALTASCSSGSLAEPDPVGTSTTGATAPAEVSASTGAAPPIVTTTTADDPPDEETAVTAGDIVGYDLMTVQLDGEELLVAVADSTALRARGLMGVTDFGDLDGMVFAWPEPHIGAFWMWTVPISLDVAFFDGRGRLVDVLEMAPCVDGDSSECPRYQPAGAYVYALERQEGKLVTLPEGAILEIDPGQLFQQ